MAQRHKEGSDNSDYLSELEINSKNSEFIDLRRCFKTCVKDMTKRYMDEKEDSCSSNCIQKYLQIQSFLSQKMNNELNKLIMMDPKIKQAFMSDQKRKGF